MKKVSKKLLLLLLFPLSLVLNYYNFNKEFIEKYYSRIVNKNIIEFLSNATEFLSFSLYDITIICATIFFFIYFIVIIFKIIKNRSFSKKLILKYLLNCSIILIIAYFLYIFLWTLNYKRVPFDETIGLKSEKYTISELKELYIYLINRTNELREHVPVDEHGIATTLGSYESIFERASKGYEIAGKQYETLEGNYGPPTKLLFSEFFNYAGITGVYFPFTGQPGVNINAPIMTVPATTLHEIAHQRGYAREEEANFIAFLVANIHPDIDFKYSGYILALTHTGNSLYEESPELYKELNELMSEEVKKDKEYRIEFWNKYSGKIEKVASKVNDNYLKYNGVSDGTKSYGRMVDLLLEYYFQNKGDN